MRSLTVTSLGWGLVPIAALLCNCSSTYNTAQGDGGKEGGTTPHHEAGAPDKDSGHPDKDSGGSHDAGHMEAATGSGLLGFTPSNIACSLNKSAIIAAAVDAGIDAGVLGDVDISSSSLDALYSDKNTASGITPATVAYLQLRQSDGTFIGVYIANSWTIESTGTITLAGDFPIALVALKDIMIYSGGLIDGTSDLPGGFNAPAADPGPGGGPGGGPGSSDNPVSIGAGGGSYCGLGGVGSTALVANLTPAYGTTTLTPIVGGSSGGNSEYAGGQGGGAVQLVAGTSITINGTVTVGGAPGFRVSGGGSGGAILVEAPTVTVNGVLAANGGGGANTFGGTPQPGQPNGNPALGSSGTSLDGGDGTLQAGNGSAGATINGGAAQAQPDGGDNDNAGGGGGAGYIRINTMSGVATIGDAGTLSPSSGTTCMTQGTISSAAPTCQ